jgi:hypothetical protein
MERQINAKWQATGTVPWMRARPESRVKKSQLRDPRILELASRELVEVITGGDDDVAMLPWRSLVDIELVFDYAAAFIKVITAAQHTDIPRALLGDYAFFADLDSEDQQRFLGAFGEALAGSIRDWDPSSVRILINSYRTVLSLPPTNSSAFNGEFGDEVDAVLATRVPIR